MACGVIIRISSLKQIRYFWGAGFRNKPKEPKPGLLGGHTCHSGTEESSEALESDRPGFKFQPQHLISMVTLSKLLSFSEFCIFWL